MSKTSKASDHRAPLPEFVGLTDKTLKQWRRERPDIDLRAFLIGVQITRVGMLARQIGERTALQFGIGAGEMLVITALRRQGPPYALRPTDLFRMLGVTSGTMTYRIDKLVGRGLVERIPDPEDGRGSMVHLTPEGVSRADAVVDYSCDFWRIRMGPMAEDEAFMARMEIALAEMAARLEAFDDM